MKLLYLTVLIYLSSSLTDSCLFNRPDFDKSVNLLIPDDRRWSLVSDSLKRMVIEMNLGVVYMPLDSPSNYSESFADDYYDVRCCTRVDTSSVLTELYDCNGNNLLVGYNHIYDFALTKKSSHETTKFSLSKQKDLAFLQKGCCWALSNLNPWTFLLYNAKYDLFVFSFNINPYYNYGEIYYLIFDKSGAIRYHGKHKSWGGGGADGELFVKEDFIVSCDGIYSFKDNALTRFTDLINPKRFGVYAMRMVNDTTILVVFVTYVRVFEADGHLKSIYSTAENHENALIFSLDGTILKRFRYYDFYDEMDSHFRVNESYAANTLLFLDSERQVLGFIDRFPPYNIREVGIDEWIKVTPGSEQEFQTMKVIFEIPFLGSVIRVSKEGQFFYKKTTY